MRNRGQWARVRKPFGLSLWLSDSGGGFWSHPNDLQIGWLKLYNERWQAGQSPQQRRMKWNLNLRGARGPDAPSALRCSLPAGLRTTVYAPLISSAELKLILILYAPSTLPAGMSTLHRLFSFTTNQKKSTSLGVESKRIIFLLRPWYSYSVEDFSLAYTC